MIADVDQGKPPDVFRRIQDPDARRFIGRCLERASKRSSAKELLLDPFLRSDDHHNPPPNLTEVTLTSKDTGHGRPQPQLPEVRDRRRDMTITGKMNPVDDTIFLKVLIADKDGIKRNVCFPFDIVSDTPIDVATEMVKELEISDREPSEIAEVIAREISVLVPDWKGHQHQVYSFNEDGEHDGLGHPFYYMSSPSSSYVSEIEPGYSHGEHHRLAEPYHVDWLPADDLFSDDDDKSSMHSGKYSNMNYHCEEPDNDPSLYQAQPSLKNSKLTRFCPEDSNRAEAALAARFSRQCSILPPEATRAPVSRGGKPPPADRRMKRNRSMVDVRSQLLHRTLLEELNRRLFKTVGAVENIGFQALSDRKGSSLNKRLFKMVGKAENIEFRSPSDGCCSPKGSPSDGGCSPKGSSLNKRLFKMAGKVENIEFRSPSDGGCSPKGSPSDGGCSPKGSPSRVDRKKQGHMWGLGRFF